MTTISQPAVARHLAPLRVALATALIVAAILFAHGVNAERSNHHEGTSEVRTGQAAHSESGERTGETAGESAAPTVAASETTEHVLGVNTESDTIVWLIVIVSVALAAGILLAPKVSALVWVAATFCLAAGVFDIAEIFHEVSRSDTGLAVLAAVIAAIHSAGAALSVQIQRQHG